MPTTAKEEYIRAHQMALKERKELEALSVLSCPAVLEEVFPGCSHANTAELPSVEIPADRVIGTVSASRTSAFSASFLPLPEPDSEFAMKWIALCEAHLSDAGIREPIDCVEYLGEFYVREGHKRVSVLRYFGAVRIPARVRRILPEASGDPRTAAYFEFLDFYRSTGVYDILFTKPGGYARLLSAVGAKSAAELTEAEVRKLVSVFVSFKEAFAELTEGRRTGSAEDALLLFLKVHPYKELCTMTRAEIKKALAALWDDVKANAEPEALTVKTEPASDEKKGLISKLISVVPKHLSVAFICQGDPESSAWTRGHADGAAHLAEALAGSVTVRTHFGADSAERAEALIDEAVSEGAELIFTTTPPLITAALKAAVKYPKIRFFSCSAYQPLSSVRSYYCRTYEGKFITGVIAGALASNDIIGYVGSYPILGVPASINAFAAGVRMTNPRAKILLEWSCMEYDCVKKLREKGAFVISNRDVPVPDVNILKEGAYGTFIVTEDGRLSPVASPCWMWGRMYENIVRSVLSGGSEKKDAAVNYWWGMDSGVIDVALTELVPDGVRALAMALTDRLKKGEQDVFAARLAAQDGSLISDGERKLGSAEILLMDRLADSVIGRIPEYEEIFPMSRALVRELGLHRDRIPPEADRE